MTRGDHAGRRVELRPVLLGPLGDRRWYAALRVGNAVIELTPTEAAAASDALRSWVLSAPQPTPGREPGPCNCPGLDDFHARWCPAWDGVEPTEEEPNREPTPDQERAWDQREDDARGHALGDVEPAAPFRCTARHEGDGVPGGVGCDRRVGHQGAHYAGRVGRGEWRWL